MIKFIYCVRRHPDFTPEAFRKYWLEKHGPLVRKYAKSLKARRYIQSHTLDTPLNLAAQQPRGTQPAYDGITEIWWDRVEDLVAALARPKARKSTACWPKTRPGFVTCQRAQFFLPKSIRFSIFERDHRARLTGSRAH